ncbi:DUF6671 family protein [Pseudomonas sp. N040]|uniref:DUF6671 family protein n=1 Tax=Pseudomonas sp. N040 TaxID=2785325 RepID=UPI0018A2E586|nr:DUF6671 family protein [Pseudomonas sp. N040]MBF7728794.1 hypothetical protein [Pseudomonas sp. N040]MBW7012434.1 7-cyano-7-deazaguanine synthase [Pseudomonas sp. N040]
MQTLAFLTKHDKAPLVADCLADIGFAVKTVDSFDTDRLGTFSREVARTGSAHETALTKARLAAQLAGTRYGLGSEGSFGRDPYLRMLPWDSELLCWWDAEQGYAVYASQGGSDTNYAQRWVTSLEDARAFASKAGFPEHALIIGQSGDGVFCKGLRDPAQFEQIVLAILHTQDRVWLETDMRAHLNPSRQALIKRAANQLAMRLAINCPACQAAGYSVQQLQPGLACLDCAHPTAQTLSELWLCGACGHAETRYRTGFAEPGHCPQCNP